MYDARSGEKYDIVPSTSQAVFVSKNVSRVAVSGDPSGDVGTGHAGGCEVAAMISSRTDCPGSSGRSSVAS